MASSASTTAQDAQSADQQALWQSIVRSYKQAQDKGAAYQTETHTELLPDPLTGISFVIRKAVSLRDKPKGDSGKAGRQAP